MVAMILVFPKDIDVALEDRGSGFPARLRQRANRYGGGRMVAGLMVIDPLSTRGDMRIEVWNGEAGGPGWWARALGFAALSGLLLGLLGPFGSYLNGGPLLLVGHWLVMCVAGIIIVGALVPRIVRLGTGSGLPRSLAFAIALLVAALPTALMSRTLATAIWSVQTAHLRFAEWYGQTLLIETVLVGLWIVAELARQSVRSARQDESPAAPPAVPDALAGAKPVLCLQMEDHYVRIHRHDGSKLELMPLHEAIARYGGRDGLQVHRSWWVAADAVTGAERDLRNWRLRLVNGLVVPVARNRITDARNRGWIGADSA